VFTFPKSAKKQLVVKNENIPNTNDNLSEGKSKKIISHYETVIVKGRIESAKTVVTKELFFGTFWKSKHLRQVLIIPMFVRELLVLF
jgi:hypothetical protein